MSASITDEEYESAQSMFLDMIKKEFSTNGSKGTGRTSGTTVVTSSRYKAIKNYLELIEKAEAIEDTVSKVQALKAANNKGLPHWKSKYFFSENIY